MNNDSFRNTLNIKFYLGNEYEKDTEFNVEIMSTTLGDVKDNHIVL